MSDHRPQRRPQRPDRPDRPARPDRHRTAAKPSQRSRATDPARYAAYATLRAVADGAYANLDLPRQLREHRVRGRDAAFATELAYGTIRMERLYDAVLAAATDRPLTDVDEELRDVLRLGVHQLLGMRVPAHAAVDQTVALARQERGVGPGSFVNAVLRRVSERERDDWVEQVTAVDDPVVALGIRHSHPDWVVRALRAGLLGHEASTPATVDADLAALLAADNEPAAVSLVARPGLVEDGELEAAGAQPSPTSPYGYRLPGGDPGGFRAVREGRAAVQDEGSQLVAAALLAADVAPTGPQRWLDLCAGPGGKAGLMAAVALSAGASLRANEVSEHRSRLVRRAVEEAQHRGADVRLTVADGRGVGGDEPSTYDRVLVDAPCTGLGALRRRPEARWRRQPSDLPGLTALQRDLLGSALDATRPGGVVGYATCSPHLAETRFLVTDLVRRRADVQVEDARGLFRGRDGDVLDALGDGPFVQLWPHVHGTDAMFFALLRRRAE